MPRELLGRLTPFREDYFPRFEEHYRRLVSEGRHPTTLLSGCSDSRIVPYRLTGTGPGARFIARNVGNFVPPFDAFHGHHGTAAAIEFAVLTLGARTGGCEPCYRGPAGVPDGRVAAHVHL